MKKMAGNASDVQLEELDLAPQTAALLAVLNCVTLADLVARAEIVVPTTRMAAELTALFHDHAVSYAGKLVTRVPTSHKATGGLQQRWTTVASWLEEHHPDTLSTFCAPAAPHAIASAEQALQLVLPADYKQFLLLHNGQDGGAWAQHTELLPVEKLAESRKRFLRITHEFALDAEATSAVARMEFQPSWVPIGQVGRTFLCIDVAPAELGIPGQVIAYNVDDDAHSLLAESFSDLVALYFEQVQSGVIELE